LGQTRWPKQRRIVGELELRAEVDALKRLQAESRRGLHPPLDALTEPQVNIDTSLLIFSPIMVERKAAVSDRALKSER
jgi:hypothetical protein